MLLALVVAAGLGVDAYVHWDLAPGFDGIAGTASPHISQGALFRLETALALMAMLLVLLPRRRLGAVVAFLVAAGGLGAVLLSGYVDVGGFGPLPNMYDPIWYPRRLSAPSPNWSPPWERSLCLSCRSRPQTPRVELWGARFRCPLRGSRLVLGPPAP